MSTGASRIPWHKWRPALLDSLRGYDRRRARGRHFGARYCEVGAQSPGRERQLVERPRVVAAGSVQRERCAHGRVGERPRHEPLCIRGRVDRRRLYVLAGGAREQHARSDRRAHDRHGSSLAQLHSPPASTH
jgi:hypothetical protein